MRRKIKLSFAALAALTATFFAVALSSSGAATVRQTGLLHSVHLRSVVPRTVQPSPFQLPVRRAREEPDIEVENGVPPSMRGGKATTGLPPVVSDGRADQLPGSPLTPNGNFANLLAFSGATWANTGCGCEPPDTQMAAGRNEIVEDVNNNLFVFSRGGTQLTTYPLTTIFQPPGQTVGLTDPKILFDPTTNLYYVTEMVCQNAGCSANNYSHMGISLAVTSDPLGPWTIYDYLNDGQNLQDQEKLGFSGDKITFAVNEYNCKCGSGAQYKQENLAVLQKSDVVAGDTLDYVVYNYAFNTTPDREFDWMPTTPINASTSDNTQYVVWNNEATSNNKMGVMRITGTPDGGNVDVSNITRLGIANSTSPPAGVEPDTAPGSCLDGASPPNAILCTIATDKKNFQSATVQGTQLWATGTDGCTPENDNALRACTRLVEVTLDNNTVAQDFDVGTQGTYRYNPSVTKDGSDHLYFGFTISSSSIYPTAALDASTLPPPTVFGRINFLAGDSTYTGGRWGDYSGTQQDPVNTNDIWTAQEYGACTTCSNFWATALGQFTFQDPHITSVSPNHGPADGGTTVDIFGSEFAQNGTTVNFGGNASPSVTWIDSTHIRAVSPAGNSGTVDITAATAAGTSDVSGADHYTYNPVLYSVTPANGPDTGGQSVTILGAGLNGATSVSFGGTAAASYTVVNPGEIDAVTPAHAGGTVNLVVTTSGGGASNAISYTFRFTTSTSLASSANPSVVGASVTYTATVSPVPNGGTMSFTDNASPIAGCQGVAVSTVTGTATCTVTYTSVGSHSIVATYSGNFYYLGSAGSLTQQVTYVITALYDQTKPINSGANVPIKVQLRDAFGTNVSSASIVLTITGLSPSPAPGIPPSGTIPYVVLADGGPGYQLNVKTSRYPPGTYTLSFTVTGDPVTHSVQFVLR